MSSSSSRLRWLWRTVAVLALLVICGFAAMWIASDPRPEGLTGREADALARRIERAIDLDAWRRTGAIRWTFAGRNLHLWDRQRDLHEFVSGDLRVVHHLYSGKGCASDGGQPVGGELLEEKIAGAYAAWVNDSFWLNPLEKLFDPGVERALVALDEKEALLVTFGRNGLTPGDSYLFLLDEAGRPTEWRMWTPIPIGGLRASWEDWKTLDTGARVATRHSMMGFDLKLEGVTAAHTLPELPSGLPDPFDHCKALTDTL